MPTTTKDRSNRTAWAVGGFFLLHVLCCGLPLLIAAGALGAAGSVLANPWVIAAAAFLAAGVLVRALQRRRKAASGDTEDCCAPGAGSGPDPVPGRITARTNR
ncbi:hypothetical protein HTS88_21235 [Pseudarthrobacter oxydans]|uniref:hypothetical protein n=1 Tax=Pseudarthrobacter oxydans TaxID=1671 RepID=UPI0015737D6E|nr:hypothetical protein [Pseudarthrobacter oxydans]